MGESTLRTWVPAGMPVPVILMPTWTPVVSPTVTEALPAEEIPPVRATLLAFPPSMWARRKLASPPASLMFQRAEFVSVVTAARLRPRMLAVAKLLRMKPVKLKECRELPDTFIVR